MNSCQPIFFSTKRDAITAQKNKHGQMIFIDQIENEISELKLLREMSARKVVYETKWVFFPWKSTLVRVFDELNYEFLRLSRNKPLITLNEQKKYNNLRVGIAGLNVGNHGAICMILEGGPKFMKFADNDALTLSNLNRFRASIADLGMNKAVLTARQAFEITPYNHIEVYDDGIRKNNLKNFLLKPKIDLLIEEMDHLKMKIEIRELSRKNRIPVIMVTGNSENIILDIERYDIEPDINILNGIPKRGFLNKIKNSEVKSLKTKIKLARDFMNANSLLRPRLLNSFDLVGKTIMGIPQLAESSFLRGAVLSYVTRLIALKNPIKSGRYYLDLTKIK